MADIQSGGWSVKEMWNGKDGETRNSTQRFWDRFDSVMMTTIIASIVITFIYYTFLKNLSIQ